MRVSKTFRNGLSVAEYEGRLKLIDKPFTVVTPGGELCEAKALGWGLDEPVTRVGSREYHGLSWARLYRAVNAGELIELATLEEWEVVEPCSTNPSAGKTERPDMSADKAK